MRYTCYAAFGKSYDISRRHLRMLVYQPLNFFPLNHVFLFAGWPPLRLNGTFVLQALSDLPHTLLLIKLGHCRHHVDEHVVRHIDDTGDSKATLPNLNIL